MELDHLDQVTQPSRVLIADGDANALQQTNRALCEAGFVVAAAGDADRVLALLDRQRFDLLVLDAAIFGADGVSTCAAIGGRVRTPIIVSSDRGTEADIVRALTLGADDYVTKPLQQRALLARINAILRRSATGQPAVLAADDVALDVESHSLHCGQSLLRLTGLESTLLRALLATPGRAVSAERLTLELWGKASVAQRHALKQVIYRLRRKLDAEAAFAGRLQTSRSAGYRWRKEGEVR